jgi:hypothetical protein
MKRIASGILWSLVAMWVGSYVALFIGVTTALTLPLGAAVAGIVILDPTGHLWGKTLASQAVPRLSGATPAPTKELAHQA